MQKHVVKALNNICQGRVSIFRESILYIFYPFDGVDLDVLYMHMHNTKQHRNIKISIHIL